ncbi:hypothetical protein Nepgr_022781 [Nepenthes gracilis]|uniref:Uncharacterized protein n=1 Tax=Nepenthes gracilis TaxID=150966 RepID=A0AAD3XYF1_NEPGR|nr:hypothetical protein Nepgr_022781 [Nepenthes gracilis]
MLDAEALKESSSAHVVPSSSGLGIVLFSPAADSNSVPAKAEAGLKGVQVDDGGASHCSVDDGGASYSTLGDLDGAHQDLDNTSCDLDQLEGSPDGGPTAENCLEYEVDDSTPDSIARISRKYSLVDSGHIVPIKVSPGDSLIGGQLGKAQVGFQDDLNSAPSVGCMVVDAKAKVADPIHSLECCPIQQLLLLAHLLDSWSCGTAAPDWFLAALAKFLSSFFEAAALVEATAGVAIQRRLPAWSLSADMENCVTGRAWFGLLSSHLLVCCCPRAAISVIQPSVLGEFPGLNLLEFWSIDLCCWSLAGLGLACVA